MKLSVALVCSLLLVAFVSAMPATQPATEIGNNNFTLSCTGAVGNTYFKWGSNPDYQTVWTKNLTPDAGAASTTEYGSPIAPSKTYYAVCCDTTGCDDTPVSFVTTAYVPLPVSTLGTAIDNMTESRFNLLLFPNHLVTPYAWLFPADERQMGLTVVFGVVFFFIYIGLWLRTRSVATGVVMGLLTSSFVMFANEGLMLGIPVEFQSMAQALLYASLAGVFLAFLKK